MKRCRTCNRTYTDPNLTYCIEDGTPLTSDVPADESTVVTPPANDGRSTEDEWNAVGYRPPSGYVPPGNTPAGKKRRVWPWVVGVLGAFILGAVALTVVAVIFVPRMVRSRQPNPPVVVTTEEAPPVENVGAPAPTDEAAVLAQLTEIENDWTVANLNADKKKLDQILADDYVGPSATGGLQGKKEYLATMERDTRVEKWQFDSLKVRLAGDRATLTGKITYFVQGQPQVFDFTDKFVWRNGRWQATGSEVHPTQQTDVNYH
jgi:hypothetical protein